MERESYSECKNVTKPMNPLREKLSQMSLEALQQLKDKLGTKIFDEAMFGSQHAKKRRRQEYSDEGNEHRGRRARRNMPLEVSSKFQPRKVLPDKKPKEKPTSIDPRFDPLYGAFDPKKFKETYGFINNVKKRDILELKREQKNTTNPELKKKLDFGIKKMENELREEERLKLRKQTEEEMHQKNVKAVREGRKANQFNKTDLRALELVEKYEKMKKSGKVLKSIAKQRQRIVSRNRKKFESQRLGRT